MPRWTIADVIAASDTIYANCSDPRCFASTKLDLDALAARLGAQALREGDDEHDSDAESGSVVPPAP